MTITETRKAQSRYFPLCSFYVKTQRERENCEFLNIWKRRCQNSGHWFKINKNTVNSEAILFSAGMQSDYEHHKVASRAWLLVHWENLECSITPLSSQQSSWTKSPASRDLTSKSLLPSYKGYSLVDDFKFKWSCRTKGVLTIIAYLLKLIWKVYENLGNLFFFISIC